MSTYNLSLETVIEWDIKNWSRALSFWHKHTDLNLTACRALEIGSRKGGLSLYLAQMGAHVVSSDITAPGAEVRLFHQTTGCADKLNYASLDICAAPFANDSFDIIIFKSVLGALRTLPKQQTMMKEIYRVLKPGGELWFAENLQASALHHYFRKAFVPWGKSWRYVSSAEIAEFCRSFNTLNLENYGFFSAFGRTEKQRTVLGTIDAYTNSFLPDSWKYIVFGLARKQ